MQIGIGLPANLPGVPGKVILEWARKADAGPFSSLGLIDRLVFGNYDVLIALAGASGATQRIRLTSTVLLAPLRNAALLAKQAASLDVLSGGRFTLGLGIGSRADDYQAVGVDLHRRGKIFDEQLETMHRIWSGQPLSEGGNPIGPLPVQQGGPEILIGGSSPAALRRLETWGDGYISGGGGPQRANQFFRIVEETWQSVGREGKPRLVACIYFALGPDAQSRGGDYIRRYYGAWGESIAQALPTTPEAITGAIKAFADIGTDELILWPCTPDLDQIDRVADLL